MGTIQRDTVKGVKWSLVERLSTLGIQFVLGLVLARLLTPADYGLVGLLGIFFAISQSFIDSGFSNALIRKVDRTELDFSTAFYFNIAVGLACYGVLFLLAPCIASFFNAPVLCPILRVSAINLLIGSLTVVQVAKLTIEIDFKSQAKASVVASSVSGVFGIILAWHGYGVWALVAQGLASSVVYAVTIWWLARWHPMLAYSWTSFHNMFSYGSKLLASGLLHTLYSNMTTVVIGKFYTPGELGYYSRGESIANLPCRNFIGVLQRVTFPILARLQDDDDRLLAVYRKYIRITSLGIIFMMTLLAALAKPLVLLLLTDKWSEAIPFLQIFCFALMFDHICQLNLNLLQVKGRSDLFLRLEIVKKAVAFLILMASIPFGVLAICLSKVVYTQIAVFANTYYTGKLFGLGYFRQFADFCPYLVLSLLACLPAYLLAEFVDVCWVGLPLGAVVASTLYGLMLRLRNDEAYGEFVRPVLVRLKKKMTR